MKKSEATVMLRSFYNRNMNEKMPEVHKNANNGYYCIIAQSDKVKLELWYEEWPDSKDESKKNMFLQFVLNMQVKNYLPVTFLLGGIIRKQMKIYTTQRNFLMKMLYSYKKAKMLKQKKSVGIGEYTLVQKMKLNHYNYFLTMKNFKLFLKNIP